MNRTEFEETVDRVLEGLPDWVLARIDNLRVIVEERPPEDLGDVLGVYEGVALGDRGDYFGVMPDTITVFRAPHMALGLDDSALEAEIRKTVLHEVAHHLGIDDRRLTELGWG